MGHSHPRKAEAGGINAGGNSGNNLFSQLLRLEAPQFMDEEEKRFCSRHVLVEAEGVLADRYTFLSPETD